MLLSFVFRCNKKSTDQLLKVDGLIGFGTSNRTMLSQIAATGAVKEKFAHCLDGVNGGGFFAIGDVVH